MSDFDPNSYIGRKVNKFFPIDSDSPFFGNVKGTVEKMKKDRKGKAIFTIFYNNGIFQCREEASQTEVEEILVVSQKRTGDNEISQGKSKASRKNVATTSKQAASAKKTTTSESEYSFQEPSSDSEDMKPPARTKTKKTAKKSATRVSEVQSSDSEDMKPPARTKTKKTATKRSGYKSSWEIFSDRREARLQQANELEPTSRPDLVLNTNQSIENNNQRLRILGMDVTNPCEITEDPPKIDGESAFDHNLRWLKKFMEEKGYDSMEINKGSIWKTTDHDSIRLIGLPMKINNWLQQGVIGRFSSKQKKALNQAGIKIAKK